MSVVIPTFNSSRWLPSTIEALVKALALTSWNVEIIVVDDGSTDGSDRVLLEIADAIPYPLRVLHQSNQGRFLARWNGVNEARHEDVLIMDSRMLVHERTFQHLSQELARPEPPLAWNGHVVTDETAPLVGRFWEVPTYAFWGDYLSDPRPTSITAANFDRVPKGTSFLLIRKEIFKRACLDSWPEGNAHLVSDDTKILRFVAEQTPIRLDPGFSATYRPRTNLKQFLGHSWIRGTLFVDSYAGTSALRNTILIALSALPPTTLICALVLLSQGAWTLLWAVLGLGVLLLLTPAFIATARRCPPRATLSYLTFVLPFGFAFWAGLTRGIVVHRRSFLRHRELKEETRP
ncbi:glycosyltransferase family 2 protein [Cryobacterium breve]|uniref:Glycosyltransferase family 2 protein n=1 Tax=Cryobacterium breve TaxID=1259258 RepID=A0ABY2JD93_9MICO|nr:glycosyltransferase family 2 protein [Cryobacterium sp. TmT3-12]TFD01862.1 glycosyltransferase family 2 protein [Cryobacterium breve]